MNEEFPPEGSTIHKRYVYGRRLAGMLPTVHPIVHTSSGSRGTVIIKPTRENQELFEAIYKERTPGAPIFINRTVVEKLARLLGLEIALRKHGRITHWKKPGTQTGNRQGFGKAGD